MFFLAKSYLIVGDSKCVDITSAPAFFRLTLGALRVTRVRRGYEHIIRPEVERQVLQHERKQPLRVFRVLLREDLHVRVAIERASQQTVQVAVHLENILL